MFERFTDKARHAIMLAQERARAMNHAHIGTEHILLGLLEQGSGVAARVLTARGLATASVLDQVERTIGLGKSSVVAKHIPFTPRAKRVLELSLREALSMGHGYIGTEHIVIALLRQGDGVAARLLTEGGLTAEVLRADVLEVIGGAAVAAAAGADVAPQAGIPLRCSFCGIEGSSVQTLVAGHDAAICSQDVVRARQGLMPPAEPGRTCSFCGIAGRAALYEKGSVSICDRCVADASDLSEVAAGPRCPRCAATLETNARYRILAVPEDGGEGRAQVLFVFCAGCGHAFDTLIAPEDL